MTSLSVRAAADLHGRPGDMLISSTETLPGYQIVDVKGMVRGNTVRARHVGHDLVAIFKTLVGGEISEYTKLLAEAREQALDRMRAEALARGANAIIGAHFATANVMQGAAEILAYGTAVVIRPVAD